MDLEVVEVGVWYAEMWRGFVVVAAAVLAGGLVRVYMERANKLPKVIERNGPSPTLALLNLAGAIYIILDITRNIGNDSFNWYETPLASVIVVAGAYLISNEFRKKSPRRTGADLTTGAPCRSSSCGDRSCSSPSGGGCA